MCLLGVLNIIFFRIPLIVLFFKFFKIKISLKQKTPILYLYITLCVANFFVLAPEKRKPIQYSSIAQKICFSNQRVLSGAVEMYNDDNSNKMEALDISLLIKDSYIKSSFENATNDCFYYSEGDLSKDGYIICKKHGSNFLYDIENGVEIRNNSKENKDSIYYKIKEFFSSYDNSLYKYSYHIIDKNNELIPFESLKGLEFFFIVFILGFTIRLTNIKYIYLSCFSLLIVTVFYVLFKMVEENESESQI